MKPHKLWLAAAVAALPLTAVSAGAAYAHGTPAKTHHHAVHHHATSHRRPHRHAARQLHFRAEVVRANAKRLVLRTTDGRVLSFRASQIRSAKPSQRAHRHARRARAATDLTFSSGGVVINILGLQPGTVVDVTETIGTDGSITITISLPPAGNTQQTSGVVTDVGGDAFTVVDGDGTPLRIHLAPDTLSALGLQTCQTVDVTYHEDAGVLVGDSVNVTGTSTDGSCAPTSDTKGVITQVSSDSVSIDTGSGVVTFSVDPSSGLTDGYQVGDLVDITSTGPDGSAQAICISFVEQDASGPVTSVTTSVDGGSLTLQNSDTGDSLTVFADPNNGVQITAHAFNGISVGDSVSVTYHQSAGKLIADTVNDQ